MTFPVRVLVVGCGHMGTSHALAYHASPDFEIVGLVSRNPESRCILAARLESSLKIPQFGNYVEALAATRPDAVCISTYPDSHAEYAILALESGCHVFLEKPIATTLEEARRVIDLGKAAHRKIVVGYILQHHPAWSKFVTETRMLGKPLVMRMNLNQQSSGGEWNTHKEILRSMSPIVDCGVHYVDVMCRMTQARPTSIHAIGARLSEDIPQNMYNYGQLQIRFEDGSIGWYEAGWGPMISKEAFFVKDVIGPKGSVSISARPATLEDSSSVDSHTKTDSLVIHRSSLDSSGKFEQADEILSMSDEPDHNALCANQQAYFLKAIRDDLDLAAHLQSAYFSLAIVLAADTSIRCGRTVDIS